MCGKKTNFFACSIYLFIWVRSNQILGLNEDHIIWTIWVQDLSELRFVFSGVETDKNDAIVEKTECQTEKLGSKVLL